MAKIEGFRVGNFKVLKDVTLGRLGLSSRLWRRQDGQPLTAMTAVIGKNGVGESALFDAFGFLADALKSGPSESLRAKSKRQQCPVGLLVRQDSDEVCWTEYKLRLGSITYASPNTLSKRWPRSISRLMTCWRRSLKETCWKTILSIAEAHVAWFTVVPVWGGPFISFAHQPSQLLLSSRFTNPGCPNGLLLHRGDNRHEVQH